MKKLMVMTVLFLGFSGAVSAQSKISNDRIERSGDDVVVTFEVQTEDNSIPRNRKEVILPYLYNGKDTLYLDPLEVYGKNRYKREKQEYHIAGDKDWELGENQILKGDVYLYAAQTRLKRWMKPAQLGIKRQMVGCACENDMPDELLGQYLFEEPAMPPRRIPDYVLADAEKFWDFGQDELEIIFKVSKIEIDSSVFDNELTFGKILTAVDKIHSNPKYKIEKIQVAGYASPEGPPKFNTWLGENRAKALINYIIEHRPEYELTMEDFEIVNGEENWAGLKRVLEGSDMKERDQVIAVIDDESLTGEQKKLKIWAMNKGRVWRSMLKEIYPHLRSARYLSIYYDSTDDKAVDTINQANALIREGKYAEGYELAMTVQEDMRAHNTIGVALMLQGRFEEAMPWFEKALEGNCPSARQNIEAINAEFEYEAQKRQEIEEYLKKYE